MSEWEEKPLEELTLLIKDGTHGTHKNVVNGIPLLSAKDIYHGKFHIEDDCRRISLKDYKKIHATYEFGLGDILLTVVGTIGRVAIINDITEKITFQRSVAIIRFDYEIFSMFAYYQISSDKFVSLLERSMNASAQGGVYLGELAKLNICYPPLPHQRKIARILTTVDNIIEKTESAIEKYNGIKQGMMHDLFTRGIDIKTGKLRSSYEDAPELYKETELGMIPKEWDICVLNDYCSSFINGGTPSTKNSLYWQGNIPWITGADFLETFEIGLIRRKITYEAVKNSATHVIPKGNILLVTRTGVGKLAIAPTDIAISQDITGLILDSDKTIINYFYYYFQRLVEGFKKMNQGTSINGIIRDDLINYPIHVPKTTEQTMVAAKLLHIDNRLKNERQYLYKQKKLKQGLMQDLLTGKQEVTPDPEDFGNEQ